MQSGISADYTRSRIISGNGFAVQPSTDGFGGRLQSRIISESSGTDCVGNLVLLPGTGVAESNILSAVGIIYSGVFAGITVIAVSRYQRVAAGSPRPYSIVKQLKAQND